MVVAGPVAQVELPADQRLPGQHQPPRISPQVRRQGRRQPARRARVVRELRPDRADRVRECAADRVRRRFLPAASERRGDASAASSSTVCSSATIRARRRHLRLCRGHDAPPGRPVRTAGHGIVRQPRSGADVLAPRRRRADRVGRPRALRDARQLRPRLHQRRLRATRRRSPALELRESHHASSLLTLRRSAFAGIPTEPAGPPPNFTGTLLVLEQRYSF